MPQIAPDRSEWSRCISMHWSLPVQCDLPCTHRENWHETWRPDTANRLRYRRAFGIFRTEELIDGEWTLLDIPPPVNEHDELLAKLTEAEADRDRAREIAVALEQENARVREIHRPLAKNLDNDESTEITTCLFCDHIREVCNGAEPVLYPCETIRVLDAGEAL